MSFPPYSTYPLGCASRDVILVLHNSHREYSPGYSLYLPVCSGGTSLFNSHSQQDAAEFMFYVVSQFDDVLREVTQAGQQDTLAAEDMIPKDWQPINGLFQVSTQSVTHCLKCPAVTTNEDRGIDLTVQIDNENPTLVRDLNWGIKETMKMEHMKDDNQRFCEKCNTKEDAHVYHYFTSLPKIMILRLQRYNFKEGAIKLQNSVSCTEQLNFKEWMCGEYQGPDPRYGMIQNDCIFGTGSIA